LGSAFTVRSTQEQAKKLVISAGLVSKVVCAVTAQLGELPHTQANRSVVDKSARKIMRDASFRNEVIRAHIEHIIDAFFACREHQEKAGRARRRVPRWLLKAMGFRVDDPQTT